MTRRTALRIATASIIGALLAGSLYFRPRVAPPTARTFNLAVQDDAAASGAAVLVVNQGDTVTLRVKSDRGGQIMIHGYEQELAGREKELRVGDDGRAVLTFVASKSGRYMIHVHREDQHLEVAQIDVQPR
jgi:hypothetical protein